MYAILIVDDHAVLRQAIIKSLEETGMGVQCDEASEGDAALRMVASRSYDLVLLDISLPGRSGLDVLKQLKREKPMLPVLMLGVDPKNDCANRCLLSGACGYLCKETAGEEIEAAVQKVLSGGRYLSPLVAKAVVGGSGTDNEALSHHALSFPEAQFLRMFVRGKSPFEIAEELSLSIQTVSTFRSRVLAKLKLSNNAELLRYAIRHHLTD